MSAVLSDGQTARGQSAAEAALNGGPPCAILRLGEPVFFRRADPPGANPGADANTPA